MFQCSEGLKFVTPQYFDIYWPVFIFSSKYNELILNKIKRIQKFPKLLEFISFQVLILDPTWKNETKTIHNSTLVGATVTFNLFTSIFLSWYYRRILPLQILECSYHFIHRLWKLFNENHSVSIETCIVTSGDWWWWCVCCCCCRCCFSQCQCVLLYVNTFQWSSCIWIVWNVFIICT